MQVRLHFAAKQRAQETKVCPDAKAGTGEGEGGGKPPPSGEERAETPSTQAPDTGRPRNGKARAARASKGSRR
eukprot:836750-Alexandrium_andersonii.AAC.1